MRQLGVGEDGARLLQQVVRPGLVAGEVARAEVRDDEPARARLRATRAAIEAVECVAADGEPLVGLGEGRLVDEEVCAAREFDGRAAVDGVGAVDDAAALLVGAAEVRAVERAAVRERDALAALEPPVERPRRDASARARSTSKWPGLSFSSTR